MATDLQKRAGRNWPPFLNQFNEFAATIRKLVSKEEIILENPDDRRFAFPAANVVNGSTDPIDVELHLVDDQGNEALMSSTSILSGNFAQLVAVVGQLAKTEKLLFRVTSVPSIFSGIGVRVAPQTLIFPGPQNGSATTIRQLVDTTTVLVDPLPGTVAIAQVVSVSNFGSDGGQTVTPILLFENGAEQPISGPVSLPARAVTPLSPFGFPLQNVRLKLQFSNLPNNKYFVVNNDLPILGDAF